MESWPRPGPVDQLEPNVRIPGQAWGTNVGQDWGQDVGTRLGTGLGTGLGTDHGTRLGTGQGPTGTWELSKNQGTNVRTPVQTKGPGLKYSAGTLDMGQLQGLLPNFSELRIKWKKRNTARLVDGLPSGQDKSSSRKAESQ